MAIKQKKLKAGEDRIYLVRPEEVVHHKLASMHREMTELEFEALKYDIELNGQLLPVILYRDKLVDGRHRQRALIESGTHSMKAIKLDNNLTLQEVKEKVMGTENRRTDNVAQKSIRAFLWLNENGATQSDAATKFGINQSKISEAKKLFEEQGAKLLDKLYKQGYLMIGGRRMTQISLIRKAFSTIEKEQPEREPVSDWVGSVMQVMREKFDEEDIVGIAQIESYAKNLRQGN